MFVIFARHHSPGRLRWKARDEDLDPVIVYLNLGLEFEFGRRQVCRALVNGGNGRTSCDATRGPAAMIKCLQWHRAMTIKFKM